jgi:RecB family exonuclease
VVTEEIAGVPWVGKIDRVEDTGDVLRIVDYKTSTRAMSEADSAESVQLGFYTMAAQSRFDRRVADAQFWYPRTNAKSVSTRSLEISRLEEIQEKMSATTQSIREEDWSPLAGDHCKRCSFRLSCPAWPEGRGAFLP